MDPFNYKKLNLFGKRSNENYQSKYGERYALYNGKQITHKVL